MGEQCKNFLAVGVGGMLDGADAKVQMGLVGKWRLGSRLMGVGAGANSMGVAG